MATELHDDLVQRGALAKGFHTRGLGIAVDLLHGLLPLLFCLRVEVRLREDLQFQDVTVLCGIVREVGQEEEVAVAMVQFQLGCRVVVTVQVEIGHEETLQVALGLDAVADGGGFGV